MLRCFRRDRALLLRYLCRDRIWERAGMASLHWDAARATRRYGGATPARGRGGYLRRRDASRGQATGHRGGTGTIRPARGARGRIPRSSLDANRYEPAHLSAARLPATLRVSILSLEAGAARAIRVSQVLQNIFARTATMEMNR